MDTKAYISSGILEQYVLHYLSPQKGQEVENYALQFPEIQKEIESIQYALELFAKAASITPRPELKQRIIEKIKAEGASKPKD